MWLNEWSLIVTFKFRLKNIFTFKKLISFANLLIEKPGNWFAIAKMWEKCLKKKNKLTNGPASLLKISLWNKLNIWFIRGTYVTNAFFQAVNELKRLTGYSKWLH